MIGMSDRTVVYEFLDELFNKDIEKALEIVQNVHYEGKDILKFIEDNLEALNLITKLKLVSKLKNSKNLTEIEKQRAIPLSEKLSISVLSRTYQMMLKIYQEAKIAENALQAFEMGAIRIFHMSQVPDMESLLAMLKDTKLMTSDQAQAAPAPVAEPAKAEKPAPAPKAEKPAEDVAPPPFDVDDESQAKK
jgi:DNA polymerase-3 subunit gamma/tau